MNNALKIAIPLLDDEFKKEDFDSDSGFVEAYLEDKNRPYLDTHIFLMYSFFNGDLKQVERDVRFTNMKTFHSRKVIRIKDVSYILYTFCAFSEEQIRIKDGLAPILKDRLMKVFKFWKCEDDFVNTMMFCKTPIYQTKNLCVPEEDYAPRRFNLDIEDAQIKHAI